MILQRALPLLAIVLSACASPPERPQAIPAVAQVRQCPAYPLPPAALLKPPAKTDFLSRPVDRPTR